MKIYLRETYCTYESCIFYLFNILFNTLFKVNVYKTTTTKFTTFTSTTKKPNKMNKLKLIKWDLPISNTHGRHMSNSNKYQHIPK